MVLASLVYQDKSIITRQKIFVAASEPLDHWHHDQSVVCRSVADTRTFLVDQLANGHFLKAMQSILDKLESHSHLSYVGFTLPEEDFVCCICTSAHI